MGSLRAKAPLGLRMRNDDQDFYTDSIDNRQVVNNLSSAERYYASTYFVTGTCNQREQFGVRKVKEWIDSDGPLENFPHFDDLDASEEAEVRKAIQQAAGTLIFRNWMEVTKDHFSVHCPQS